MTFKTLTEHSGSARVPRPPQFYRACDNEPVCQEVLASLGEPGALHGCQHVITDLLALIPEKVKVEMFKILSGARAEFKGRIEAGQTPKDFQLML